MKFFLQKIKRFIKIDNELNRTIFVFKRILNNNLRYCILSLRIFSEKKKNYYKNIEILSKILVKSEKYFLKISFKLLINSHVRKKNLLKLMDNLEKFSIITNKVNFWNNFNNIEEIKAKIIIMKANQICLNEKFLIYIFFAKENKKLHFESNNIPDLIMKSPQFIDINELKKKIKELLFRV